MNARTKAFLAAPLILGLAACGDDPAATDGEGEREAAQEVLEGSISDAMLPVDKVRSAAPLAAPEPGEDGAQESGGASGTSADGASEPGTAVDEEGEPAAASAPEPEAEEQ